MSNKARLEVVSSSLDTAIATAESLPEAGGGGASVETCTVTVQRISGDPIDSLYITIFENGVCKPYVITIEETHETEVTVPNVVCGSTIVVGLSLYVTTPYIETEGGASFVGVFRMGVYDNFIFAFRAPQTAGAHGVIVADWEA